MTTSRSFEHLIHMSDDIGLFEHAEFHQPRTDHGYCVDDVARGLVVLAREPAPSVALQELAATYLRFIGAALAHDGRFHNRRNTAGHWTDKPTVEDCWGRALWGLGSAVAHMPMLSDRALALFNAGARQRSPWLHSMCFAALGAAEVLMAQPRNTSARALLRATARMIALPEAASPWPWPEPRLRYANAVIPQVLVLAGTLLDEPRWTNDGLRLLTWLVALETPQGHLSVTPVGGWEPGETRPGFDQQPIEVAALADACSTAFAVSGEPAWLDALQLCAAWFDGHNDARVPMADHLRGAGFDGLHETVRNGNQGAESTLALLSTLQTLDRHAVGV